jgi:hypothetical protein
MGIVCTLHQQDLYGLEHGEARRRYIAYPRNDQASRACICVPDA